MQYTKETVKRFLEDVSLAYCKYICEMDDVLKSYNNNLVEIAVGFKASMQIYIPFIPDTVVSIPHEYAKAAVDLGIVKRTNDGEDFVYKFNYNGAEFVG